MKPTPPPTHCYQCAKPLQTNSISGGIHQEGWYYWDGNCYCTQCWQGILDKMAFGGLIKS